jgi:hypothetical protein
MWRAHQPCAPNFAGNGIPALENCKAVKTPEPGSASSDKASASNPVLIPVQKSFAKRGAPKGFQRVVRKESLIYFNKLDNFSR